MYNTFSILIHVYFSTYLYLHLHIVSILYAYIMDLNNVSHIQLKKYIYFPYIIPSSIKSINTPFFFPQIVFSPTECLFVIPHSHYIFSLFPSFLPPLLLMQDIYYPFLPPLFLAPSFVLSFFPEL